MAYFRSFATVFVAICLLTFNSILAYVGVEWRYDPPNATASLALDRIAREYAADAKQPSIAARVVAFVKRALMHTEYSAGHFDPGRSFA